MTKMQIIAKTFLTILGIYAILTLCRLYTPPYLGSERGLPIWWYVVFFSGFVPLVALVIFFLIFNNDGIARRMAGPGQISDRQTQTIWLIKSLRIGLVLTGLMLLPKSIPIILNMVSTIVSNFRAGTFPDIPEAPPRIRFEYVYNLIKAALAIYLVYGAPHFIHWQAGQSLRRFSNIEQEQTPSLFNTDIRKES
jgi:hypothetical protein